jgi:hypothetical protein
MTTTRDSLVRAVQDVLANAASGRGRERHYLTSYQILDRLPPALRDALIVEYGPPGRGAGANFTSASRIAQIAREVGDYDYLDAQGLAFGVGDVEKVAAGYSVVGIYRAKQE